MVELFCTANHDKLVIMWVMTGVAITLIVGVIAYVCYIAITESKAIDNFYDRPDFGNQCNIEDREKSG